MPNIRVKESTSCRVSSPLEGGKVGQSAAAENTLLQQAAGCLYTREKVVLATIASNSLTSLMYIARHVVSELIP